MTAAIHKRGPAIPDYFFLHELWLKLITYNVDSLENEMKKNNQ